MKSLRLFTYSSAVALLLSAATVSAQEASPFKFEFHGFVTGSLYMQNQVFGTGSGQGLLFFAPAPSQAAPCEPGPCAAPQATKSGTFFGGDVRQSRYVFALTGPKAIAGGTPKAYFEGDLLGFQPGGLFTESWTWRIRQAFAEIKWSNFTLQAGQHSAHLAVAQIPDSVSHIANPYTFGAGTIGWRTMGLRGIYTMPMGDMKLELAGSIVQPTWGDNTVAASTLASINSGMASGTPQLEGRVRLEGKSGGLNFNVYADALWNNVDLKGFGETRPNGLTLADGSLKDSATVWAAEVGGKVVFAPVFVAANFYTGQGLGSIAGGLLQQGEIGDMGYWVQAGVFLTKEFSLNATFGQGKADEDDVRNWVGTGGPYATTPAASPRADNQLIAAQAKYMQGGYAFALEYISYKTTWLTGTIATPGPDVETDGYQVIASAGYFF